MTNELVSRARRSPWATSVAQLTVATFLLRGPVAPQTALASPTVTQEGRTQQVAGPNSQPPSTSVLGPGDQVVIHALDVQDISEKPQRLDLNGDLKLPMIGREHATGLTAEQLEAELTKRLSVYLREPDVSVTVAESRSQPVSVIGAVHQAGVHQLEAGQTLIEVLSRAGGPSPDAGSIVRITRRADQGRIPLPEATDNQETGFSVVDIPLRPLLDARTPEKNILICPNDLVSVPPADVVYVVGDVNKVGPVPLTRGRSISIVEALSESGGVLRTAAPKHARILRLSNGSQKRSEIAVDVNKIMQGQQDDVPLVAGDILVVPSSGGQRAMTRALDAAIQAGLMFGTYGILR